MSGRPRFKPTPKQRDRVKLLRAMGWTLERIARQIGVDAKTLDLHFTEELEHGADDKRLEVLEYMRAAAKKGNASAGKWLHDHYAAARAAENLEGRASPATAPEEAKAPKLGKKEQQQEAAARVEGKFAPPAPPKLH